MPSFHPIVGIKSFARKHWAKTQNSSVEDVTTDHDNQPQLVRPKKDVAALRDERAVEVAQQLPSLSTAVSADARSSAKLLTAKVTASSDTTSYQSSYQRPPRRTQTNLGLKKLIAQLSRPRKMGMPLQQDCFPEHLISNIITESTINDALPRASEGLKAFALSANKVFAVLLQIISDEDQIIATLESFKYHHFDNGSLPVTDMGDCCEVHGDDDCEMESCSVDNTSMCTHDVKLNVFHHHPWDSIRRTAFYGHQWKFLIPSLMKLTWGNGPQYCRGDEILPVVKLNSSEIKGSGYFSEVYKGKILAEYQNEVEKNEEWVQVAIKQLKNRNEYIVEKEWIREIQAFSKFNQLRHDHITRAIAACRQGDLYYIFLEWANGDNLRKFWSRNPRPLVSGRNTMEFLYQLYGLVDALHHMHEDSEVYQVLSRSGSFSDRVEPPRLTSRANSGEFSSSSSPLNGNDLQSIEHNIDNTSNMASDTTSQFQVVVDSPMASMPQDLVRKAPLSIPQIVVASDEPISKSSNWRHGDIKPENILVFKDDSSWIGTLKLGDLGRAKQHQFTTVSPERQGSGEGYRTKEYEPPEAVLVMNKARSRKYDIWSMGCIIFEAIYWLLYGNDEQKAMTQKATDEDPKGTRYWVQDPNCKDEPKASVNPVIQNAINWILTNDPACKHDSGTALKDLLVLVRDYLLVIHVPDPKNPARLLKSDLKIRTTSDVMRKRMNAIIERAETDPAYLFQEADRTSLKGPLDSQTSGPASNIAKNPITYLGSLDGPVKGVDSYAHEERDVWEFQDDESFTSSIFTNGSLDLPCLQPQHDSKICDACAKLDFQSFPLKIERPITELHLNAQKGCELCSLLAKTVRRAGMEDSRTAYFECSESNIRLQWRDNPLSLSICQTSPIPMRRIRRGLPSVSAPGSTSQFALMRSWIEDCDKHSMCHHSGNSNFKCPTRLIDVGLAESAKVYVVERPDIGESTDFRYVVLSHAWGDPKFHKHFTSTRANIEDHKFKGISIQDLPNTFRDAIQITRHMHVKYLWIDSLCILQGEDGDFDKESKSMEYVFSSAYFTIAASSSLGTSSHLLGPRSASVMEGIYAGKQSNGDRIIGNRKIVRLRSNADNCPIFIAESLDNFQEDVLNGPLNQRGWVFQERALSRRTMYFTEKQMYWECGQGVRCETLTKLRNPKVMFLGDPNFPEIAVRLNRGGQIYYYETLYEQYSKLRFTYQEDRSVAIYGLEARINGALGAQGGYGVFKNNLGRGLLWRRSDATPLVRIDFSKNPTRGRPAPSWSWMAYVGSIEYMSPVGGSITWQTGISVVLDDGNITSTLKGFVQDCDISKVLTEREARLDIDDGKEFHDGMLKCIVIGTEKLGVDDKNRKHYVLIVQESSRLHSDVIYERLGVGWILGRFIGEERQPVLLQ